MEQRTRRVLTAVGAVSAVGLGGMALAWLRLRFPRVPRPRGRGVRVAAVGDSITYGVGVNPLRRRQHSYPAQLGRLLGPAYDVINYGASGRTLQDTGDSPYRATELFGASLDARPAAVLLMLGTNDSKPQNWDAARYERQLEDLVRTYQDLPSRPTVYLLTPPAAFGNPYAIRGDVIADPILAIVRRVGATTSTSVVDVHAATADQPSLFPDGVHPNRHGAAVIARTVYGELTRP